MPIIAEGTGKNKWFYGDEKNRPNRAAFYKEEGDVVIQYRSGTNTDAGNNLHKFLLTIG